MDKRLLKQALTSLEAAPSAETAVGASRPARWMRSFYDQIFQSAPEADAAMLEASALVIAPHPDDESLGCGGTIIRKRRAGADVSIVFMTDGSASHSHGVAADRLVTLRKTEAVAACEVLGLRRRHVHFLDLKDGRLGEFHERGTEQVAALLELHRPAQVFVPYRRDPQADHRATFRIVLEALERTGRKTAVVEYPVWAWRSWPWALRPLRMGRLYPMHRLYSIVEDTLFVGCDLAISFRTRVDVSDVLAQKRAAVFEHKTQCTRIRDGWFTLGDVSGGEFLTCFFREYELFRRFEFEGR